MERSETHTDIRSTLRGMVNPVRKGRTPWIWTIKGSQLWARLSSRGVDTPCFITPRLSFPPRVLSHHSSLAPQGHYIRAVPMQHMVNRAHTRVVAANLLSDHLAQAGNHRHGTARHSHGRESAPQAADV